MHACGVLLKFLHPDTNGVIRSNFLLKMQDALQKCSLVEGLPCRCCSLCRGKGRCTQWPAQPPRSGP